MITLTEHARDKLLKELQRLGIMEQTITQAINNPDELLYDVLRNRFVAINWKHKIAIIYEKINDDILIITVIYSSRLKEVVNKRRQDGRWI
ncbi:MAG: hypothetical protein QXN63_00045 [Candidatus Bathyarchaeia archaeon]